jgi:glycyl-tRNA synthetase
VLPHADRPSVASALLTQLAAVAANPDFVAVAEAVQRARRIVPPTTPAGYDAAILKEPAEVALHTAVTAVTAELGKSPEPDLYRFTEIVSRLVAPLATFFDEVFVMDEDEQLRAARLGLLATVRDLGAGLLDWSELQLRS